MRLFDAHCHLQDSRLEPDIAAVMQRAAAAGVQGLLCCGAAENDWDDVARLSDLYPQIIPAFGLHPLYLEGRTDGWLAALAERVRRPGSTVGEIGLDNEEKSRNMAEQEAVFMAQMELARDTGRPVAVHCRRAGDG